MRSTGVHHVDLVVSDLALPRLLPRGARPARLARCLQPAGRAWRDHPLRLRTRFVRRTPGGTRRGLGLPVDRYRVGLHHLCFEVAEKDDLDRSAGFLCAIRAPITDGPRHFPEYREGYHALYLEDPDGLKLELVWTPDGTYDYQRFDVSSA